MSLNEPQPDGPCSVLSLGGKHEFRVLKIDQSKPNGIFCDLSIADLDAKPQYIALSYTWGPATHAEAARGVTSDRTHPVVCNGREVLVTENLHSFLTRAVRSLLFRSNYLWIDMLCIDQFNPTERTNQLKLMANIYNSAEFVLIWLGEEDEHTRQSFDLIQRLATCPENSLKRITPRGIGSKEFQDLLEPYGDVCFWTSVKELFKRRYFKRVWIIQEVTLAKRILALCGPHSIDWDPIVKVSEFLTNTSWTRWICPRGVLPASDSHESNHAIPNLLQANKQTRIAGDKSIVLYSLIRSRRFMASDPRDKVYALLGICGDFVVGKSRFTPVYGSRTAAVTFTLAAIQILEDSDNLLLLACIEGDNFQTIPLLPSWVPDWSCNRVLGLGVTGYKRFSAAGNLPRSLTIDQTSLTLIVKGFKLDVIVAVGECKHEVIAGESFPQWLSIIRNMPEVYHTGQPRIEVFWRTLITDTAGVLTVHPAPLAYGPAFSSWFSPKLATHASEGCRSPMEIFCTADASATSNTASNSVRKGLRPMLDHRHEPHSTLNDSVDAEEYETTFSHSPHLRPFLTGHKYFGVGSESLLEQDSVWIVAGSRVPLILRKENSNSFRIVGGAYVHGFMNGEALELTHTFRDIIIL